MKWWDWMPWSLFSECWVLSQFSDSPLSRPSKYGIVSTNGPVTWLFRHLCHHTRNEILYTVDVNYKLIHPFCRWYLSKFKINIFDSVVLCLKISSTDIHVQRVVGTRMLIKALFIVAKNCSCTTIATSKKLEMAWMLTRRYNSAL